MCVILFYRLGPGFPLKYMPVQFSSNRVDMRLIVAPIQCRSRLVDRLDQE